MLKLRRLRIDKFRSVAPGTELRFSDGFNVLLGQNGTGKTTLLELISMVVRSNFESLAKEEFAIEYELEKQEEGVLVVAICNEQAQKQKSVSTAQVQSSFLVPAPDTFRASAEIHVKPSSSEQPTLIRYDAETGLKVGNEPSARSLDIPSCMDPGFLFYYLAMYDQRLATRFFASLHRAGRAQRFDESLDLFTRLTDSSTLQGELLGIPGTPLTQYIFGPFLLPDALVEKLSALYTRTTSDYALGHADLDFLNQIKAIMGFAKAELKVDVIERQGQTLERVKLGNLVFRFWWEGGDFITHERLSYGQKRLLTFFYYLASNPEFVIADELVNGLHHRWIAASVEAIGQRQAFLTSQNPLLFDYLPLASPEEVRSSFVLCRSEPRDGRPGWVWENMSEEDAAELFAAHEVGIEHVSEILQSRGLW